MSEVENLKTRIAELEHQLKTVTGERDLLAVMLTDYENQLRQGRGGLPPDSFSKVPKRPYPPSDSSGIALPLPKPKEDQEDQEGQTD